jgi:hypothetical protein
MIKCELLVALQTAAAENTYYYLGRYRYVRMAAEKLDLELSILVMP